MTTDTFNTISSPSKGMFKDKGSRFISFAFPVRSVDEVKHILDKLKKDYHDAKHHCYAYNLGYSNDNWRINDDGEPSGTAGKPIHGQIRSLELTNILVVVVRYFGGTLLGVSGLINAYRTAASDALNNCSVITQTICDNYKLKFSYNLMNDVMKIIKDENICQSEQVFDLDCSINVSFRLSLSKNILDKFSRIEGLTMTYLGKI
jgi:uncharacterized YigZ family protein